MHGSTHNSFILNLRSCWFQKKARTSLLCLQNLPTLLHSFCQVKRDLLRIPMASSSSAIDNYDQYDVFLSFRGEDTRYNFTSHLFKALCDNNIKAFIDNKIDRGDEITPALQRVIDGAKISIIVFSKNYAESPFCLDELVRIMECKESKAQVVLPIFYKVEPSEATYQEAFARHETSIKVEGWKSAFRDSLGLAGWHIVENSVEAEIIGKITKVVSEKLNNNLTKGEELMCKSMVGQTAEDNFKEIWECLMDDKISRVGLYGMGGVGKTTIATRINDQLLATVNSFSRVCWVTMSKDLSICNMQNKIAEMIMLDFSNEDDERKRAAKLRKRLKTEKFVLILDDLWEAFEIEDVGIPPLVYGQKLLMTSRSRRVCERMECETIEVKPLSDKDALDLFIKESKCQINYSLQWRDIVDSIVEECGGLPLAIVVIARRMKGVKEIWKWRDTLRELQKPCKGENPEIEEKVFKVLKFSYDRLHNDRCRQCFLYCSLFPEDHKFKRKDLIEYWIGVGLINELDCRQAELDKGNVILDELVHASLLETVLDWDFEKIKMHDVIRDMARMNVKVGLQVEDSFESVQVLKNQNFFPISTPHCSKLKTLLLDGCYICFSANMQRLNVLHITSALSISDSITNLENLRVLIINKCDSLGYIPSLVGLEILKGIGRLVNLRVLDLSDNWNLHGSFPSGDLEKLSHLQTLNLTGTRVEVETEALISLENLQVLKLHFHNLHKLNFYLKSGYWRRLLEYHIHYGYYSNSYLDKIMWLKIMTFDAIWGVEEWKEELGMFFPDDIQYLRLENWESPMFYCFKNPKFVNLQSLHINRYRGMYLFTVELAQHLLRNVQLLKISYCSELEEIIGREEEWVNPSNYVNYAAILLPNLKRLELFCLSNLKSIYRGRMVCPFLELIQIFECDILERLPFCSEKEGNKQNSTIQLENSIGEEYPISRRWWNSLQWEDPNAKSMYQHPELSYVDSESEFESEC